MTETQSQNIQGALLGLVVREIAKGAESTIQSKIDFLNEIEEVLNKYAPETVL